MTSLPMRGAVVTGANRGIGKAIALAFLRAGWPVTAVVRNAESMVPLRREAGEHAGQLSVSTAELSDAAQVEALGAALAGRDLVPGVLINNAGVELSAPLHGTSTADLSRVLAINTVAPYLLCRALIPAMAQAGGGRVVNIGSIASLKGIRYTSAYCASKHALLGLTRALAIEWASKGMTVNLVCPGWTDTDMLSRALDTVVTRTGRSPEQARAAVLAHNPIGRPIAPAEVASLVLYLASPAASTSPAPPSPWTAARSSDPPELGKNREITKRSRCLAPCRSLQRAPFGALLAAVRVAQNAYPR